MSHTAALESKTSESKRAPDLVPKSVPDPVPVPSAGLSSPSKATCTAQPGSNAPSGQVPGESSTVGASDEAPSAVPAGASSRASVTGFPEGPHPKEPPRVPLEVPARESDSAAGNSKAPGATNPHSVLSSGTEKASSVHHPTAAAAPATGGEGAPKELMFPTRPA